MLSRWVPSRAQAVCFLVGLDDSIDPFRLFHGLSQALVGLALYYLWQASHLQTTGAVASPARGLRAHAYRPS